MKIDLRTAQRFAKIMDSQFRFFGLRFGIDSILGLIPWAGDLIGLILSTYLLVLGYKLGMPKEKIILMVLNILVDFGLGSVPVIGDVSDIFYKANSRNLKIIEEFVNNYSSTN